MQQQKSNVLTHGALRRQPRWWSLFALIIGVAMVGLTGCRIEIGFGRPPDAAAPATAVAQLNSQSAPAQPMAAPAQPVATNLPPTVAAPSATATAAQPVIQATAVPPTPTPSPTPIPVEPAQNPPTEIIIPSIGLDTTVQETGWSVSELNGQPVSKWDVLDFAAGWHSNSALPGHGSNIVLSGHHNIKGEVFRYVVDLERGDLITLRADGRDYDYIVTDHFIVPERDVSEEQRRHNAQWIMPTTDERLTLVTCWPYTDNSHRVIVIAKPANNPQLAAQVN